MSNSSISSKGMAKVKREKRMKQALFFISWGIVTSSLLSMYSLYNQIYRTDLRLYGSARTISQATTRILSAKKKMSLQVVLMKIGDSGSNVETLQQQLAATGNFTLGYFTQYFGPVTQQAVESFQSQHHLPVTGNVDQQTFQAINQAAAAAQGTTAAQTTNTQASAGTSTTPVSTPTPVVVSSVS